MGAALAYSNSTVPHDAARRRIIDLEAALRTSDAARDRLSAVITEKSREIAEQRAEIESLRAALGLKAGET